MECVAKTETVVIVHPDGPGSSATGVSMKTFSRICAFCVGSFLSLKGCDEFSLKR